MGANHSGASATSTDVPKQSFKSDADPIGHNIETVLAIDAREELCVTRPQRVLETILDSLGRPIYLFIIVLFCMLWIFANILLEVSGLLPFDMPPFHWLQGIIGLAALLIMIVVLIKQNRQAKIDERRAHLELQVTLLTEHKTAKLIKLLMELRRDMPTIRNRRDREATAFQKPTDPEAVLAALDEHLELEARRLEAEQKAAKLLKLLEEMNLDFSLTKNHEKAMRNVPKTKSGNSGEAGTEVDDPDWHAIYRK